MNIEERLEKLEQSVEAMHKEIEVMQKAFGLLIVSGEPTVKWLDKQLKRIREVQANEKKPDARSKAHSIEDCWCGMPHQREDFL